MHVSVLIGATKNKKTRRIMQVRVDYRGHFLISMDGSSVNWHSKDLK